MELASAKMNCDYFYTFIFGSLNLKI